MSRRVILIIACGLLLFVLLAAGTVGFLLKTTFTSAAAGQSRNSPDGKWVAHALTFQQKPLFGERRNFSELRIDTASPSARTVRKMIIEDTAAMIDWRMEGEVFWKRNSSEVTFKCVTGKANLEVALPVER
jgi:hypothetical protein